VARKKTRRIYSLSREVVEYLDAKAKVYEASFEVEKAVRARAEFKTFIKNKEKKNESND